LNYYYDVSDEVYGMCWDMAMDKWTKKDNQNDKGKSIID